MDLISALWLFFVVAVLSLAAKIMALIRANGFISPASILFRVGWPQTFSRIMLFYGFVLLMAGINNDGGVAPFAASVIMIAGAYLEVRFRNKNAVV